MSDKEDKVKKERGLLFLMIVFFTVGLTLYFIGKVLVKYVISQGYFNICIYTPPRQQLKTIRFTELLLEIQVGVKTPPKTDK